MSSEQTAISTPIVVHMGPTLGRLSDREFFEFCQLNRDLRMERTPAGDLIIMPPTGGTTGRRNLALAMQLGVWSQRDGTGVAFDSSTGFRLPRGGERSPDASWVGKPRWNALTQQQRDAFPPLAPDFVVELRSPTDRLADLQDKMREYIDNGVRLGWLIDPLTRTVWVYRPGREVEELSDPIVISAAPELPGFELRLEPVWQ